MTEYEQEVASFLYFSQELGLHMSRDDHLYILQGLLDTGDIWRYNKQIFDRVELLLATGELPLYGEEFAENYEEDKGH